MQRDISHFATSKLQGGWSAADFAKNLTKENLQTLQQRFDKLEPLVRVRLLLSQLSLDSSARQALQPELQELTALAREDKDEWVSITAKALASSGGPLDLDSVLSGSAVVRKTVADLERLVEAGETTAFRPQEEIYLNTSLVRTEGGEPESSSENSHFTPRDGGASSLPELSRRATASAAAAASLRAPAASSSPANPSLPLPRHLEPLQADLLSGPQPSPSGVSTISRQSTGVDMFRSSRPVLASSSRQLGAATGLPERKGEARPRNIKLLDVNEVKKLGRHPAASPDHAASNGHAKLEEDEMEEGELEAGEIPDDTDVPPHKKRPRLHAEGI